MSKFVKLRDVGTIFHDSIADVTVTGALPVEVKKVTPKIAAAIRNGILVEVKEKEAKQVLADAKGKGEEHKKKVKGTIAEAVEKATEELNKKLEDAEKQIANSNAEIEKLEKALGSYFAPADYEAKEKEAEQYKAQLEELNKKLEDVSKDAVSKADYDKLVAELASTKDVLKTTKEALAKSGKKNVTNK